MTYISEETAAKRTCHQRLYDNSNGPCIGSKCMAWRWRVVTWDKKEDREVTSREVGDAIMAGEDDRDRFKPQWGKVGYCGLAGNPE